MSNRTLIEINHDYAGQILNEDIAFVTRLYRYLCSASRETAEELERFGVKVIGMRHHSGNFILDGEPEGFPVMHLTPTKAAE